MLDIKDMPLQPREIQLWSLGPQLGLTDLDGQILEPWVLLGD